MTDHSALANSELHEPKGVAAASDGQVYVADGAGSGAWEFLFEEKAYGAFTTGTSFDLTGLGDYAAIYLTTPNIRSSSTSDYWLTLQLGNSSGLTTSAVYYSTVWDYNGGATTGGFGAETSLKLGYSFTSSNAYEEQSANILLLNFNKERNTVGGGVSTFNRSAWPAGLGKQITYYVKEQKAYDRLRVTSAFNLSDGNICVMGLKG